MLSHSPPSPVRFGCKALDLPKHLSGDRSYDPGLDNKQKTRENPSVDKEAKEEKPFCYSNLE